MHKLMSAFLILVAFGLGVQAIAIYFKPSNKAFREYLATAEAGDGWISERDRCRIGTKIGSALMAEKDPRYGYWHVAARRACREAVKVAAEAIL